MNNFSAGFGLSEITPLVGTPMNGYIKKRYVTGVNDPLFARALALSDGTTNAMIIVLDLLRIGEEELSAIRSKISNDMPVQPENIWVLCTHTHTGPSVVATFETPKADDYAAELPGKVYLAAHTAWLDLAPCEASFARQEVSGIAFERRYRMKDGSVRTNPGCGNSDIVEPMRNPETPLTLVTFERDATRLPIVLASFPCHADVVGGTIASADYPGHLCNDLTHELPGHPETIFLRGPAGDINHIDVNSTEATKGQEHAHKMAQVLTKTAVGMWETRKPVEGDQLSVKRMQITVDRRPVDAAEVRAAKNQISRVPGHDMEMDDASIWGREVVLLSEMPEQLDMEVCVLQFGDFALVALQGEIFSALSEEIKNTSPAAKTLVTDCAGGRLGYVLTKDQYEMQGYEERPARSSPYAPGTGEAMVAAAQELLG